MFRIQKIAKGTKNKILFERKRVPFLFLYLYFTNFFLYIDDTWTDLHKYVDGFTQNTWTDLHNTWTDLHMMLLYVEYYCKTSTYMIQFAHREVCI